MRVSVYSSGFNGMLLDKIQFYKPQIIPPGINVGRNHESYEPIKGRTITCNNSVTSAGELKYFGSTDAVFCRQLTANISPFCILDLLSGTTAKNNALGRKV